MRGALLDGASVLKSDVAGLQVASGGAGTCDGSLVGASFTECDLSGALLSGCNMSGAALLRSDLHGA